MINRWAHFFILIGLTVWTACNSGKKYHDPSTDEKAVETSPIDASDFQRALDQFYRTSDESPVRRKQGAFSGLHFYPIDPNWAVSAQIEWIPDAFPLRLPTNKSPEESAEVPGSQRPYLQLRFVKEGREYQLTVYQLLDPLGLPLEDVPLFLPFADRTNGHETYGGGRYLDIPYPPAAADSITLDFNRAYHPYCAYNGDYICPLVPPENQLDTKIRAGIRF